MTIYSPSPPKRFCAPNFPTTTPQSSTESPNSTAQSAISRTISNNAIDWSSIYAVDCRPPFNRWVAAWPNTRWSSTKLTRSYNRVWSASCKTSAKTWNPLTLEICIWKKCEFMWEFSIARLLPPVRIRRIAFIWRQCCWQWNGEVRLILRF